MIRARYCISLVLLLGAFLCHGMPSQCDVCGGAFGYTVVTFTDKVDGSKKWLCEPCADLTTVCYECGIPAWKDFITLSDGRVLCKRDKVGIVLDEQETDYICRDVDRTLVSMLGRFTMFPSTNVQVRMADRVSVRALVGVAGYDFSCPNLLGYTLSLQKPGYHLHDIRLLSGLKKGVLQATYAHELGHAWISENLTKTRELALRGDAAEGFCELLAYLIADTYRDEDAKKLILSNQYTRGQSLLFIEAERQFGMLDVFEWMKRGTTVRLEANRLVDIRSVEASAPVPERPVSEILYIPKSQPKSPDALELTSVMFGPVGAIATINGRTFEVDEERKVPLGASNLVLRCLSIESNAVVVKRVGTNERQRLELRSRIKSQN